MEPCALNSSAVECRVLWNQLPEYWEKDSMGNCRKVLTQRTHANTTTPWEKDSDYNCRKGLKQTLRLRGKRTPWDYNCRKGLTQTLRLRGKRTPWDYNCRKGLTQTLRLRGKRTPWDYNCRKGLTQTRARTRCRLACAASSGRPRQPTVMTCAYDDVRIAPDAHMRCAQAVTSLAHTAHRGRANPSGWDSNCKTWYENESDQTSLWHARPAWIISTGIVGRRAAPFSPYLIPARAPHGFTPRS